jgi:hypothetical protein
MSRSFACVAFAAALGLAACRHDAVSEQAPVPGAVTDVAAFEHFIAGKPTPEQFRHVYPDVRLVLPGDISTRELRLDKSRYFAELDDSGRIVGGRFR